jgi:hypothetical protein
MDQYINFRFLHLINHEYVFDLLDALAACSERLRDSHLKKLDQTTEFSSHRAKCIYTTLEIVNSMGKIIELDDRESIKTMYSLLIDMTAHPVILHKINIFDLDLLIQSLNKIFILKRQLSLETCASFVKKLLECSALCTPELVGFVRTVLFIIKMMFMVFKILLSLTK